MNRENMKLEIEKRMKSDSWNEMISGSVIGRVKKKREKESFYTMTASLAVAAISLVVFIFFPVQSENNNILTAQNYSSGDILSTSYGSSEKSYASEMDVIINEAYPMR